MGDYYEDVDQAVRNQLIESQLLRADFLREIAEAAPGHAAKVPQETSERVIERTLGVMAPMPVGGYKKPYAINCCMGNGTQALYYAWSKIIEPRGEAVQVNLLLNRVSPWMDIDSYLPYEGKVVLHNKTAKAACAGWRRRSLFNVCDLPKGLSSGKAFARVYSPAAGNSTSRLRWRRPFGSAIPIHLRPRRADLRRSAPARGS